MIKKLLLAAGLSLVASSAFAACTNPLPILNGSAASVNMSVSQNTADASCMYNVTPNQGGAPLGATNGWWTNILQGNAVISATNGIFVLPTTAATWAVTQSGTWNITNLSGTVSLPTGASTSALQPTNAAQGSTTSGQTGHLVEGAVTTGSPTYTTAQTSPLSLDTTGALRVNVTAGGAGGGAVTVASGADVVEGTITTAHGCSTAGYTVIGCLGQIDDDVKGPIAAGTNVIGHVIADTGSTTAVTALPAIPAGTNVIGHVITDTGSTTAVTALPATPAGTNTIGTVGQLPYPVGAVPLTASATGTTAATTATLAGAAAKTTYVCGYSIRANATANTNVTNTLTGVISGTMSSVMWVPANTAGLGVDEQIFNPCIPASATNTGIAAVSGAPGAGGVVTSKIWGYQL